VYVSAAFRLPRDNYEVAFPLFRYLIDYWRTFHWIPTWVYSHEGGLWIEPLTNNYLVLAPYRLVGYVVGGLGMLPPTLAYKFAFLWVGIPVFFAGVYQLARALNFSAWESALIVFAGFFSSLGMGPLHQEQAFATVFFIPFLWLLALRLPEKPSRLFLLACLLGLSLHSHYPQIICLYVVAVGVSLLSVRTRLPKVRKTSWRLWALSLLAFAVTVSPLLYSYSHFRDRLQAPDRGLNSSWGSSDPAKYRELNLNSFTSLAPESLPLYAGAHYKTELKLGDLDENNLFATPAVLFAILLLLTIRVPARSFHLTVLFLLTLLSLGVYGIAPFLLWFPGVSLFRQWYHFTTLLNFHLLFAIAFALKAFWELRPTRVEEKRLAGLVVVLLVAQIIFHLNGFYILPAVALLILKLWKPTARHNRGLAFAMVAWIGVAGVLWSETAVRKIQQYRQWSQYVIFLPSKFIRPHVGDGGEWKQLALPKNNTEWASIRELALKGAFYWVSQNGSLGGMSEKGFRLRPVWNGWEFELLEKPPKQVRGILFAQWAETEWVIWNGKGERVSYRTGPFGLVEIPVESGTHWTIRHEASLWHWLVLAMWWPLVAYFFSSVRERMLKSSQVAVRVTSTVEVG
jgi:hypothetical protein